LNILMPQPCVFSFMFLAFCHPKNFHSYLSNASCHLHPHAIHAPSSSQGPSVIILSLKDCCASTFSFHHFVLVILAPLTCKTCA
jgi:hypothetical protein